MPSVPTPPRLVLAPRQTHRCRRGHPWVFRSEIGRWEGEAEDGGLVDVVDRAGRVVGRGYYSARSQIAVRLLAFGTPVIDEGFLRGRLAAAIALRERRMPGRPCRRLVHSEADLLPGLIVDQYGDRLVVQATTVGMDRRFDWWCATLAEIFDPRQIVERNDLAVRALEGLPERVGVRLGPDDARVLVRVGRVEHEIDLLDPHKTGAYLDQQLNHEAAEGWLPRPNGAVLDCFCHLGGFALHALAAGAGRAVAIDTAAAAVAGCRAAAERLGMAGRLTAVQADVFDWLRGPEASRDRFELVVLDPPSFARNRAGVPGALRGYRDLHLRALRLLAPGGRLATFTCSHHVTTADFLAIVAEAAASAGRTLRIAATLGAAPDHPVLAAVPETEYLRGWLLESVD
jgi:23S rRNA (cytosine1962-C5)-methyltransferase